MIIEIYVKLYMLTHIAIPGVYMLLLVEKSLEEFVQYFLNIIFERLLIYSNLNVTLLVKFV